MKRSKRRHCPHVDVVGIYGDSINRAPGFRRNLCLDCGTYLDGPVSISKDRQRLIDPEGGDHGEHCSTCTCGCTCGYGGTHEPENPRCVLNKLNDPEGGEPE